MIALCVGSMAVAFAVGVILFIAIAVISVVLTAIAAVVAFIINMVRFAVLFAMGATSVMFALIILEKVLEIII